MPQPDYKRIGALMVLFASADDEQVGRAMDQIDDLLAQGGMTWAQFGAEVSKMGAAPKIHVADPRRAAGNGARPKSQWALDREDVVRLYNARMQLEGWTREFIDSLHDQVVVKSRSLTDRQREILHDK